MGGKEGERAELKQSFLQLYCSSIREQLHSQLPSGSPGQASQPPPPAKASLHLAEAGHQVLGGWRGVACHTSLRPPAGSVLCQLPIHFSKIGHFSFLDISFPALRNRKHDF